MTEVLRIAKERNVILKNFKLELRDDRKFTSIRAEKEWSSEIAYAKPKWT